MHVILIFGERSLFLGKLRRSQKRPPRATKMIFFTKIIFFLGFTPQTVVFCKKTHSFWSSIASRALCRKKTRIQGVATLYYISNIQGTKKYSAVMYYLLNCPQSVIKYLTYAEDTCIKPLPMAQNTIVLYYMTEKQVVASNIQTTDLEQGGLCVWVSECKCQWVDLNQPPTSGVQSGGMCHGVHIQVNTHCFEDIMIW